MTESLIIGTKMNDGTYYVGRSPTAQAPMFIAPTDASVTLDFNQAADYANKLSVGGKKDFRLPTVEELNVVREAVLQSPEMQKTFILTDSSSSNEWYWTLSSSQGSDRARIFRMSDGEQSRNGVKLTKQSVRPVRLG